LLPPGSAVADRYRIERELGAGGMATVYLARDLRHEREVAIKVMNDDVVASVGADRFVNEIRTTAHLKHPHILPLFDSGTAGATLFYVMPYIDGESLRTRIRRDGPLPIADALAILREVADALAYAHAQGVVHRDIKPDNVLLSGTHAFLADFGIARALDAVESPDRTMTATIAVAGTPAYMSPEQISGQRQLDHRTDVYAFGVMAYEVLAGVAPFERQNHAGVMAAHLTELPEPLPSRRPDIPPALASLVMKCLEKKPEDRWQRMDAVVAALAAAAAAPVRGAVAPARAALRPPVLALATLAVLALAVFGGWLLWNRRAASPALSIGTMTHVTRDPGLELDPAISPDGRALAYVSGPPGRRRLYVRQIDGSRPIALTDADVAPSQRRPDWSPDGTRIVFQAGEQGVARATARTGSLYVIPAFGGTPSLLLPPGDVGVALTPSWSPNGTEIAFATPAGIYVIAVQPGSAPRRVASSLPRLHSPRWSPDGRSIVYVAGGVYFAIGEDMLGNTEPSAIRIVTLATGAEQALTTGDATDTSPIWTPDGRSVLFVSDRGGGRDVYRLRLMRSGAPEGAPERMTSGLNAHSISLSKDGKLMAYSSLSFRANIWSAPIPADRVATTAEATQLTFGSEKTEKLAISPDHQWLAFDSDRSGNADIWKLRLGNAEPQQVTRDPAPEFANDWSPDGTEILYHSIRPGTRRDVMSVTADGTRTRIVASTAAEEQHSSWHPDGNRVAFSHGESIGDFYSVYVATRANRESPWGPGRPLTTGIAVDPKWSPDGQSLIYTRRGALRIVDASGANDRPFVSRLDEAGKAVVQYAMWAPDGKTVYVKAADDERKATIWAMPASGGTPRLLMRFDDPLRPSLRREFATDGTRFFFTIAQDESDIWVVEIR
jgi:eukaryotic-like serine/threonine-protein kinase